jgi:CRISPR type I-E-associated protein CasB/Cse2
MTTDHLESANEPVVEFVLDLKRRDDRGGLALLRGALADSPERQVRAWRLLARFGGIPSNDLRRKADVVRVVAGLLALPRLHHAANGATFGRACRSLLSSEEFKSLGKSDQPGPVSRRMQHLFSATSGEICDRVRQLGRRLDVAERPTSLDFNQLYKDLLYWSDRRRARWACDFWGSSEEEEPAEREAE